MNENETVEIPLDEYNELLDCKINHNSLITKLCQVVVEEKENQMGIQCSTDIEFTLKHEQDYARCVGRKQLAEAIILDMGGHPSALLKLAGEK